MTATLTRQQIFDSKLSLFDKAEALNKLDAQERAAQLAAEAAAPPGKFISRRQIMESGLTDYAKAKAIERFDAEQTAAVEATKGTALPAPQQTAILESVKANLLALDKTRLALDAREADTGKRLGLLRADIQQRASTIDPDDDSAVQRLVLDRAKLELMDGFAGSVPVRRSNLAASLGFELDRMRQVFVALDRFEGDSGISGDQWANPNQPPWSRCAMALTAINTLLAKA